MQKENKKKESSTPHPLDAVYQDAELRQLSRPPVFSWSWRIFLVTALVGVVGGIAGSVAGPRFLPSWYPTAPATAGGGAPTDSSLQEKTTTDNKLERISAALVRVMEVPSAGVFGTSKGLGVVVTADGWVATPDSTSVDLSKRVIGVFGDNTSYTIDKVFTDRSTHMTYFHLQTDRSLPVIRFARTQPKPADDVWVVHFTGGQQTVTAVKSTIATTRLVVGVGDGKWYQTTTQASLRYGLNASLAPEYVGAAVIDSFGDVMGIVLGADGGAVLPIGFLQQSLETTLREHGATRATLGVTYVDLALLPAAAPASSQGLHAGALLATANATAQAIVSDGPAEKAGLLAGDVITQVDGKTLSQQLSLLEIIWQYQPGQKVEIVYMHAGQERHATLTLGESQ